MAETSQDTIPTISPVLFYNDLAQASLWLQHAFGFAERITERITLDDGTVAHAELSVGNGMIILSTAYDSFQVPNEDTIHYQCLYVTVSDAASHKERALRNGATLQSELRDTLYGARVYSVSDLAGYHWIFAEDLSGQ